MSLLSEQVQDLLYDYICSLKMPFLPIRLGDWEAERIAADIMAYSEMAGIKNGKCIVE